MQIQQYRQLRKQTLLAPRPAYYKTMTSLPIASANAAHKHNLKFVSKNTMKAEIIQQPKQPQICGKFTVDRNNHDKTLNCLLQNEQPQYKAKTHKQNQVFRRKPLFILKKHFNKIMDQNELKGLLKSLMKQIGQILKQLTNFVKSIDIQTSGKYNCQIIQFNLSFTELNKKLKEAQKGIDQIGITQILNNIIQNQVKKAEKMQENNKQNLYNNQISIIAASNQKSDDSKLDEVNTMQAYLSNSNQQNLVDQLCSQLCNLIFQQSPEKRQITSQDNIIQ